jgi:GNAT superfamily N-acetyltransferase/uncharacterized protein YfcZ (UPF0381/DUF406 family)
MTDMELRKAKSSDKNKVLEFCKTTFSWGDYISDVWDDWILEGNLLVLTENNVPVAICHNSINGEQLWIEGIRVNKNLRRKGFAKRLIQESEFVAKNNNCKISKMLIATNNKKSLNLASSLIYKKEEIWNFYSLLPKKINYKTNVKFATHNKSMIDFILSFTSSYVRSWRWLPLTNTNVKSLIDEKKILYSEHKGTINALAIFTKSDHFENTLMLTLVFGNENGIKEILAYLQNYAAKINIERIQILTKLKDLPKINTLEKKFSFYLMKKEIQ